MTKSKKSRRDVAAEITETITRQLEAGVAPWVRPWMSPGASTALPSNAATGKRYRGVNVMLLWATASEAGYGDSRWLTFKQAKELGGHVRKGEKSTAVVFWRPIERAEDNDAGERETRQVWICRAYRVFNVEQCDGLDLDGLEPTATEPGAAERIAADRGAEVVWGGDRACYSRTTDRIRMPKREHFATEAACEATLLHELTHWTGHESRLGRQFGKRFGDDAYAFEELVAELGAAFLCAELGVAGQLQHAEYLGHWARVLKADRHAIFTASRLAFEAAELLLG